MPRRMKISARIVLAFSLVASASASSGSQPEKSEPLAEQYRVLLDSLDGQWQGVLEYEDYQGGGRVELPTAMIFETLQTELTAKRALAFTDPGRIVEAGDFVRFQATESGGLVSVVPADADLDGSKGESALACEVWTIESLDVLDVQDANDWQMVLTRESTDANRPALLRLTQSIQDGLLTSRTEVDYTDDADETGEAGTAYTFRNEIRLNRAKSDPSQLIGTWKVDLRPTPDADPYLVNMTITSVDPDAGTFEGTFYSGAKMTSTQFNVEWSGVSFAFVTQDGQTEYATQGTLRGGRLSGTTHAISRDFLSVWSGVRGD